MLQNDGSIPDDEHENDEQALPTDDFHAIFSFAIMVYIMAKKDKQECNYSALPSLKKGSGTHAGTDTGTKEGMFKDLYKADSNKVFIPPPAYNENGSRDFFRARARVRARSSSYKGGGDE
jgi:hypothetical protein